MGDHFRKPAAEIQGRSVSDFAIAAALDAAQGATEETQMIGVSLDDQRKVGGAIARPTALAPAMKRAIQRGKALIRASR